MRAVRRIARLLALAVLVTAAAACARYNSFPPEKSADLKDSETLKSLVDGGGTTGAGAYRIVDVRPPESYQRGHIPTAINIPNGDTDAIVSPPAKDTFLILYCETGGRAERAAKLMAEKGYQYLFNWGGFGNWPYPVETGADDAAAK